MMLPFRDLLSLTSRLQASCVYNGMTETQFTDKIVPFFLNFNLSSMGGY